MTELDLAVIEARANAATKGPWARTVDGEVYRIEDDEGEVVASEPVIRIGPTLILLLGDADAEFISAAREDVPRLVEALRAVRELHGPVPPHDSIDPLASVCRVCSVTYDMEGDEHPEPWPCPTARAAGVSE